MSERIDWRVYVSEDVDALGFLYRSRPTIFGPITAAAGNAFNVQYRGLTHTERSATRLATGAADARAVHTIRNQTYGQACETWQRVLGWL